MVAGDPSVVFDRKEELNRARYLVAARITDMKANICNVASLWDGRSLGTQSGEVFSRSSGPYIQALSGPLC
jgi:hypothetical protein